MSAAIERQDIPALESVRASTWGGDTKRQAMTVTLVIAGYGLSVVVLLSLLYTTLPGYSSHERDLAFALRVLFAPICLAAVYSAFRLLWSYSYWEAGPRGLLQVAVLRKRFLEWSEIESFEAVNSFQSNLYLKLFTSHGVSWVYAEDNPADALGASILQHKGWHRQKHDEPLLQTILSFWDPVPEGIPRELDWVHPKPPPARRYCVLAAVGSALLLAYVAWNIVSQGLSKSVGTMMISFTSAGMLLWRSWLRPLPATAHRVIVGEDSIALETAGNKVEWSWEEVRVEVYSGGDALGLSHTNAKTWVLIPFSPEYAGSREVAFAITRRLREAGYAVPIPTSLSDDQWQPRSLE